MSRTLTMAGGDVGNSQIDGTPSDAAVSILGDFINIVEAERGKQIDEADAVELIAAAEEIIELLEAV